MAEAPWSGRIRGWVAWVQIALCFIVCLATVPTDALAQVDEGAVLSIKQLPESERLQLRRTLAEPTPSNATFATLLRHFGEKQRAAELLGDMVSKEAVLREAIRLLPRTPRLLNDLGMLSTGLATCCTCAIRASVQRHERPSIS
jgi:hypothetical protein